MDAVLTMWPPSPRRERDVVDAAAAAHAGVVAEDVNITERVEGRLCRALDAGGVGDVAEDAVDLSSDTPQVLDGGRQRLCLDVSEHYIHTGRRKSAGEREADAARGARHECRLPHKVAHAAPTGLATAPRAQGALVPQILGDATVPFRLSTSRITKVAPW